MKRQHYRYSKNVLSDPTGRRLDHLETYALRVRSIELVLEPGRGYCVVTTFKDGHTHRREAHAYAHEAITNYCIDVLNAVGI